MEIYQYDIKNWYLVVEMVYSISPKFNDIINILEEKFCLKKIALDNGNIIFQIFINKNNFDDFIHIWDEFKNWKNYTLYLCGEKINVDDFKILTKCYLNKPCKKIININFPYVIVKNCIKYNTNFSNDKNFDIENFIDQLKILKFCPLIYGEKLKNVLKNIEHKKGNNDKKRNYY